MDALANTSVNLIYHLLLSKALWISTTDGESDKSNGIFGIVKKDLSRRNTRDSVFSNFIWCKGFTHRLRSTIKKKSDLRSLFLFLNIKIRFYT